MAMKKHSTKKPTQYIIFFSNKHSVLALGIAIVRLGIHKKNFFGSYTLNVQSSWPISIPEHFKDFQLGFTCFRR